MKVKEIKIPEINKKPFVVATSTRNVMRVHEYQVAVLKLDEEIDTDDMLAQAEGAIKSLNETLGFIRAILNLDDEVYEKLLDVDFDRVQEIAAELINILFGVDPSQVIEVEEGPKEA